MKLNKAISVLAPIAVSLTMSACNSVGQSVLMNALSDAKSGDLNAFQSHFEGEALKEFGNHEGLARFQSVASHWESLTANESLVREYLDNGRHNTLYREDVYGQNGSAEPVMIGTAYVHCSNVKVWFCAISDVSILSGYSDF